jgi:iron complex transport system substrate-binding protein
VPVLILQARSSLQGVIDKINEVAEVVDAPDAGTELADRVQGEISDALGLAALATDPLNVAYIYVRGPQTLLLFAGGMPTQAMIEGAGGIDVGAGIGAFGPVPLTPEALIAAAPDVIVLPAAGFGALGGAEALLGVPGIAETPAGADQNFLVYEEGYFFGLGPRTGQALDEFIRDLYPELG